MRFFSMKKVYTSIEYYDHPRIGLSARFYIFFLFIFPILSRLEFTFTNKISRWEIATLLIYLNPFSRVRIFLVCSRFDYLIGDETAPLLFPIYSQFVLYIISLFTSYSFSSNLRIIVNHWKTLSPSKWYILFGIKRGRFKNFQSVPIIRKK